MTVFSGSFPEITKHLSHGNAGPNHVAGDFTIDPHQTVVGGALNIVAEHPEIAALFKSWGWDGSTKLDTSASGADELFLRQHRTQAGGPSLIAVLWEKGKELKFWGEPTDGDGSTPTPPPVQDDPEHPRSSKMPPGWKRDITYALETCATAYDKATKKGIAEGVLTEADRKGVLDKRRALVVALWDRIMALPNDIRPGEPIAPSGEGQAECDAIWDYTHQVREVIARRRLNGYDVHPAYRRYDDYFHSILDQHFQVALYAMSNVALALGLRGKWTTAWLFGKEHVVRDWVYLSALQSFSAQDPVAAAFAVASNGGGISVGGETSGESLEDLLAAN